MSIIEHKMDTVYSCLGINYDSEVLDSKECVNILNEALNIEFGLGHSSYLNLEEKKLILAKSAELKARHPDFLNDYEFIKSKIERIQKVIHERKTDNILPCSSLYGLFSTQPIIMLPNVGVCSIKCGSERETYFYNRSGIEPENYFIKIPSKYQEFKDSYNTMDLMYQIPENIIQITN